MRHKKEKNGIRKIVPIPAEVPQFQINNYVIVDNDELNEFRIRKLMNVYYEQIQHIGSYFSFETAITQLPVDKPDLIFMDVLLDEQYTCFDVFSNIPEDNHRVIFTTGSDKYFQQVFDYNMVDYIIKPVTQENIIRAVNRAHQMDFIDNFKINSAKLVMARYFQLQRKIKVDFPGQQVFVPLANIIAFKSNPNDKRKTCVFLDEHSITEEKTSFTSVQIGKLRAAHELPNCFLQLKSIVINLDRISGYVTDRNVTTGVMFDNKQFLPIGYKTLQRIIDALANLN